MLPSPISVILSVYQRFRRKAKNFLGLTDLTERFQHLEADLAERFKHLEHSVEEISKTVNRADPFLSELEHIYDKFERVSGTKNGRNLLSDSIQGRYGYVVPLISSPGELRELWSIVYQDILQWQRCDVILACPLTTGGITSLLPNVRVVLIGDISNVIEILFELRRKNTKRVGIVSPWVFQLFVDHPFLAALLASCCAKDALTIGGWPTGASSPQIRMTLHNAGFFEVVCLTETDDSMLDDDFSSVDMLRGVAYDFRGSKAGMPFWPCTHKATRLASAGRQSYEWQLISGLVALTRWGEISGASREVNLAIWTGEQSITNSLNRRISTTAICAGQASGYAELMSCYSGPGDSHMYTGRIERNEIGTLTLSLWRKISVWERLEQRTIEVEPKATRFPLWMSVSESKIGLGLFGEEMLTIADSTLSRSGYFGVRFAVDTNISFVI